jgi:hypothetical protein
MNPAATNLHIHIHKVDGSITTFTQDDAGKAIQILDDFRPAQIFAREKIVLADRHAYTALAVSKITRIDLDAESPAHLPFPAGIVEAVELTRPEFETLLQNPVMRRQWEQINRQAASVVMFLDLEMADGQTVLLTMEMNVGKPPDPDAWEEFSLNGSGLCFRRQAGGIAVLNLANVTRLTFFPGPLPTPPKAWNAHLVTAPPATTAFLPQTRTNQHQITRPRSQHAYQT